MAKKKSKTTIVGYFLKFCTYFFILILLISFAARFMPPHTFWHLAFLGLAFPYVYIINLALCFLWLIKRRKIAFVAIFALVVTYSGASKFFSVWPKKQNSEIEHTDPIKVMSYNVRNFNKYNLAKDKNIYAKRDSILNFIKYAEADIVCIQESYVDKKNKFRTIDTLKLIQKAVYSHEFYPQQRGAHCFGLTTLSSYPIISKKILDYGNMKKNTCIMTDILIGKDTIRVYNAHFSSIGLSKEDFVFIDNLSVLNVDVETPEFFKSGFRKIVTRLKRAFIERSAQIKIITESIQKCPYPVILCADLNDTPSSYAYYRLRNYLNDAFLKSGKGFGNSYNGPFPYFRIDYIFYSDTFAAFDFLTHFEADYSDHFPLTVTFIKK